MKKIKALLMLISIFILSAIAGNPAPNPTTPPKGKNVCVVLHKKSDNNTLRAPSNNPNFLIDGVYDEDGKLFLYPSMDSNWQLTITSIQGTEIKDVSTSDLACGIFIGYVHEASIELSNEAGPTFVGEIYIEE